MKIPMEVNRDRSIEVAPPQSSGCSFCCEEAAEVHISIRFNRIGNIHGDIGAVCLDKGIVVDGVIR